MQSVAKHLFITNLFISNNYLLEMIRKTIFINYFSEYMHQVAIKFRFRNTLQKKCFGGFRCGVPLFIVMLVVY